MCLEGMNREKKSPGCCSYRQLFRAAEESAPAVGGESALADTWLYSKHVRCRHFSPCSCCCLNGMSSAAALPRPRCLSSGSSEPSLPTLISCDFQQRTLKHHRVIVFGQARFLFGICASVIYRCALPRGLCTCVPRVPTSLKCTSGGFKVT